LTDLHPTARVARGATYLFIQGFGTAVVGLVYFAILARAFGSPEEKWQMGAYALLSFVLSFAQYFGTLSLQSAAVKYIAQYLAEGKVEKAKAVAVRVLGVVCACGVDLCTAVWCTGSCFPDSSGCCVYHFHDILCSFGRDFAGVAEDA
jgi:O-antigen/teichoic acid export membrane protein